MFSQAKKVLKMLKGLIKKNEWLTPFFAKVTSKVKGFMLKFSSGLAAFFGGKKKAGLFEAEDDNTDTDVSKPTFAKSIGAFFSKVLNHIFDSFNVVNFFRAPGSFFVGFFFTIFFVLILYIVLYPLTNILLVSFAKSKPPKRTYRVRKIFFGLFQDVTETTPKQGASASAIAITMASAIAESYVKSTLRYYLMKAAKTEEDQKAVKLSILVLRALSALGNKLRGGSVLRIGGVSMITDAFEHEFHLSIENKWQAIGLGTLMEFVQIMNRKMSVFGNTKVFATAQGAQNLVSMIKVTIKDAAGKVKRTASINY